MFGVKYKNEMNKFIEANCKITAEEILVLAKDSSNEEVTPYDNVIDFNMKKRSKKAWKALIPAACVLLVGTTVLAATGKLSDIFRNIFKDDKTAEIVDEGYLYEVYQVVEEDIFEIELVAVTGDAQTPKLVFDVYVNDEEAVAESDQIRMLAYTLGEEVYENELEKYAPCEAYGEKDEKVDNLYHVSMTGAPSWMNNGEPVVVDICQIDFVQRDGSWITYELNMEYRFTPPESSYQPVRYETYTDKKFTHGGIDYYLTMIIYSSYRAEVGFEYDFEGTALAGDSTNFDEVEDKLHANWLEFIDTVTIVVDGEEYVVNEDAKGYTYCDKYGEIREINRCMVYPYFPYINYDEVNSIEVKVGDISYTLK